MSSSLSLRHTAFPFPLLPCTKSLVSSRPLPFSTLPSSPSPENLSVTSSSILHYGPCLSKGLPPLLAPASPADARRIDPNAFARSFPLAALRVPAALCSQLEYRLRGHLLNWPRVPNVARVPSDDAPPDLAPLLPRGPHEDRLLSLGRPADETEEERPRLSPVLYRQKLARDFNCRGFLNFKNLAKMSRPKKRKERRATGEGRGSGRVFFEVGDVVGVEEKDEEDMRGLLGEEFVARWRGPTRLLLLDQRYAGKGVEDLPEAVKAAILGKFIEDETLNVELVKCRITIFYEYWPVSEILEALLPDGMIIPSAFETVGHIAHLNLREEHLPYKNVIAQVILDKHRPKIQTVVNKVDAIQHKYRTMELEVLAGNHSLVTTVIENGIRFHVDLARVYWNSRLSTERQRLISCFSHDDVLCDVFSGVGPIAISAAKKVKHVYANDLNPSAVEYLEKNVVQNKLDRKIEVSNMDGRRFIQSILTSKGTLHVTQVVMNLPTDAVEFLDAFRGVFHRRPDCRSSLLPRIHVYGFSKSTNPEFDFCERIKMVLLESSAEVEVHRVRLVAPGKWMLCGSFLLPQRVAFAKDAIDYL